MGKGKKTSSTISNSSGTKTSSRIIRTIKRLDMKIARWERNKTDKTKVQAGKSRNGWDTTGLCEHAQMLERRLKEGKKKKFATQGES